MDEENDEEETEALQSRKINKEKTKMGKIITKPVLTEDQYFYWYVLLDLFDVTTQTT
jgi:hypothetical protein